MAKCLVCGSSAGPFNTLHKSCLSIYRSTEKSLQKQLSESIKEGNSDLEIAEALDSCKPSNQFSPSLFKEQIIKVWSAHANKCVTSASIDVATADKLIQIVKHYEINDEDIESNLLLRLINMKLLERLENNLSIESNIENYPERLLLSEKEFMIWGFKNIARTEQQRYSQEKSWTLLRSVLDNALLKSRYKPLATKTEAEGELFVTNRALYYLKNSKIAKTIFSNIHSITPMKYGIRIQANTSGATPETYVTGDGRFAYAIFQYALRLNNKN